MNNKTGILSSFSLYPINKKIFLLSKILVGACLFAYIVASAFDAWVSDIVFIVLLFVLIFTWDFILQKIVSHPVHEISEAAQRMSDLDFSQPCRVETKGELQVLSDNLNTTAENLQNALKQRKELTDTLSHQLKTPLGIIKAYAEGLRDPQLNKQEEYSRVIIEEIEKMTGMVNDLLDLSALEAGAVGLVKERFDLVELVETTAGREFVDGPAASFQLSYALPDTPVYTLADQNRIREVLHNFMSNAKKFVSENGSIHIEVAEIRGCVRFSINNDGPRLTEDIWDKFYKDKSERNRNGSGLGLAIAAQILNLHQASYGVYNEKSGPVFYFELPVN